MAYIRFDESEVPEFSMSMFHKDLYQQLRLLYPGWRENAWSLYTCLM
jgi:dipeptidyl-peptidase-4